jgi:hypothetical protein
MQKPLKYQQTISAALLSSRQEDPTQACQLWMGLLAGQINKNHKELSLKTFSEKIWKVLKKLLTRNNQNSILIKYF